MQKTQGNSAFLPTLDGFTCPYQETRFLSKWQSFLHLRGNNIFPFERINDFPNSSHFIRYTSVSSLEHKTNTREQVTDFATHCQISYASLTRKAKRIEKNKKLFHSQDYSHCPEEKKISLPGEAAKEVVKENLETERCCLSFHKLLSHITCRLGRPLQLWKTFPTQLLQTV